MLRKYNEKQMGLLAVPNPGLIKDCCGGAGGACCCGCIIEATASAATLLRFWNGGKPRTRQFFSVAANK